MNIPGGGGPQGAGGIPGGMWCIPGGGGMAPHGGGPPCIPGGGGIPEGPGGIPIIPGGGCGIPPGGKPACGPGCGTCRGAVANMVWGRFSFAWFARCWAAKRRSAGVPCRSPLVSFLKAYPTAMERLHRYCPFIASMAESDASKQSKEMKPNPLELPVSGSRIIFGVAMMTPKALNVS